jgi:GNAT superfamily N-acetyltransferase
MKILGYDEVDGEQVLELNLKCFGWFISPKQAKIIRSKDKHASDYFALYAVEDDIVQSQVGVVTVNTRTADGIEKVGYLWGIATRPSQARQGYATSLINEAHNRLIKEGIRYSFLGTGKSLVSYDLYKKLGYYNFTMLKRGLMKCKDKESSGITFKTEVDNDVVETIFYEYSKDHLGFVKRPKKFLDLKKAWLIIPFDLVGVFFDGNKLIGYVVANKEENILKIRELCCLKKENIMRCIKALETNLEFEYFVLEWVLGSVYEEQFVQSGFKIFDESYGILMLKDLNQTQSLEDIRKSYGISQGEFQMTSLDEY